MTYSKEVISNKWLQVINLPPRQTGGKWGNHIWNRAMIRNFPKQRLPVCRCINSVWMAQVAIIEWQKVNAFKIENLIFGDDAARIDVIDGQNGHQFDWRSANMFGLIAECCCQLIWIFRPKRLSGVIEVVRLANCLRALNKQLERNLSARLQEEVVSEGCRNLKKKG